MASASAAALGGASFDGHLTAPGVGKCSLTYAFQERAKAPMPAAVKMQRRGLGWSTKDEEVCCLPATCSIPKLGLEDEEVLVSVDAAGPSGSRRMLLQSLLKPDLGITILVLDASGAMVGGDESWSEEDDPIIRAKRVAAAAKPAAASTPNAADASPGSPVRPSPPAVPSPSSGTRRPAAQRARVGGQEPDAEPAPTDEPQGFGVIRNDEEEDVDVRMPLPEGPGETERSKESLRAAVPGGIGRSAGGFSTKVVEKPARPGGGYKEDDSRNLRPDLVTGEPGASRKDQQLSPEALDEEIKAAAAENLERLVSAAAAGETGDIRQFLMRQGVKIDSVPPQGWFAGLTALMAAAQKGRLEAVSLLLEQKASPDIRDASGWTALMHAIFNQKTEVVKALLSAGADYQGAAEEAADSVTPLILAASGPRAELVQLLLDKKARPEARDLQGCRALHHAARRGNGGAVMALLTARAQLEKQDDQGR
eukprot:CAMPEP_0197632168 /NCGR_PEP_ID=MMETSP1338-20131121/9045_1 /TAXON_ID=43686 ORGANISM="Pelagodinium beii, Strain RCC1491" /NCGR_SAMPLE_ID=MMETSP1338 /ASSEMBLY_ACC=CAM_ASM_000754 /LENGTH=479 /DNA_ID=CAMNT_0043203719 /DNA_START=39 /DNA_END=1475 /DNA_ORIENTATION=+